MLKGDGLLDHLEYGPAPESPQGAYDWIKKHDGKFGLFIGGKFVHPEGCEYVPTFNPCNGEELAKVCSGRATEDVEAAVSSARTAFESWSKWSGHDRARVLYGIARQLQKHHRLFAVLESLDNGKTIRETRDADIPLCVRHFYYHAGWAQLMSSELPHLKPLGVIAQVIPWNFPLLMLAWKIAPALAMGNTVVLKPAPATPLSAMLFCEICAEAGVPPGVINILPGGNDLGFALVNHPDVDKVAFTGSTGVGRILREATAGSGKKLSLELGGKSPFLVFASADLDNAVEGIVNAIFFNQGQVCCAGSRLLAEESIFPVLLRKLRRRMENLRLGDALDKAVDVGAIVSQRQLETITRYVDDARAQGAEIFQATHCQPLPPRGLFYPPTLITNVHSSSPCVQEEIFGPVLTALSFRTPTEAVELANNTPYGLSASVWSEDISLALDMAFRVKAGVVWVNCHNLFDAAAGFGGYKESGFGRESGAEGLDEYTQPRWATKRKIRKITPAKDGEWGRELLPAPRRVGDGNGIDARVAMDKTTKLFVGGAQVRPDGAYSLTLTGKGGERVAEVPAANRKDVRNAVEAAEAAAPAWGKRAAFNRSQILFYMAENLERRKDEYALKCVALTEEKCMAAGRAEVEKSIERLFYWAAYADKYGGEVKETPMYGATVALREPVGVVGIACPDEAPLLAFVSLLAPAIVRGNAVVIVPSEVNPLPAIDLYQVFQTSDLPAGVVNILTGQRDLCAKHLAEHMGVDAVWYFGDEVGCYHVEKAAACNMKRTFCSYGVTRGVLVPCHAGEEYMDTRWVWN